MKLKNSIQCLKGFDFYQISDIPNGKILGTGLVQMYSISEMTLGCAYSSGCAKEKIHYTLTMILKGLCTGIQFPFGKV